MPAPPPGSRPWRSNACTRNIRITSRIRCRATRTRGRRASYHRPSTAATTGIRTCTGIGCWCDWCIYFPTRPSRWMRARRSDQSLTSANIAGELAYLRHEDRASFERPYGLAWLLALCAELHRWNDPQAQRWLETLKPLETEAATRLENWAGKLRYPIRVGRARPNRLLVRPGLGLGRRRSGCADAQRSCLRRPAILPQRS